MSVAFEEITTSPKRISEEQLKQFNEDGYLIFRKFLNESEIQMIQQIKVNAENIAKTKGASFTDGLARFNLEPLASDPTGQSMALRKVQEIFLADESYRKVVASDRVLDLVEDFIGPQIYYHSSKLMCKPANGGRRKPWHQDFAYWDEMNTKQVTLWFAIDPATKENGCVQIIPKSHKRGLIPHSRKEDFMIDETGIQNENIVYAEMEPGDLLIFNVLALHASDPNHSPRARLSAIVDYDSQPKKCNTPYGSDTPLRSSI